MSRLYTVTLLIYEVKWALGSITTNTASGGDGIPVELLQILKDDAVKVLHDPIDGSPPDSPVHGILQARTLEWVAIAFSTPRPTALCSPSLLRST